MKLNDLPLFRQKVLKLLLKIPKGRITTYKAIAEKLGTKACRAVGSALGKNPWPDKYPCFKVVNSDGRLGGFGLGIKDKIRRLKRENIQVKNSKIVDFEEKIYYF